MLAIGYGSREDTASLMANMLRDFSAAYSHFERRSNFLIANLLKSVKVQQKAELI